MPNYDTMCAIMLEANMLNAYKEHINEAEFPDEVEKLIELYKSCTETKDKEQVLDSIEANFSTNIIKEIAFKNGLMYHYLHTLKGRLETSLKVKDFSGLLEKKILISLCIMVLLLLIFQLFFRYEYKTYKGSLPYTAEIVKIDKLTGQSSIKILDARSNKK